MNTLRLPAERFVFAELKADRRPVDAIRPNRAHELLLYQLEPRSPTPVDELHARFVRVGPDSVLACAMPKATIRELMTEHPRVESIKPESLPDWLGPDSSGVPPEAFNLLTGEFTPPAVRSRREWSQIRIAAAVLLSAMLLTIGLQRRAGALRDSATTLQQLSQTQAAESLSVDPGSRRLHALLAAELHRLRATRLGPSVEVLRPDTAREAALLLASWPTGLQTQRLTVGEAGVGVVARCRTAEEAAELIEKLGSAAGWSLTNQNVRDVPEGYEVQLTLAAEKGGDS